jgi:hypothetical protein
MNDGGTPEGNQSAGLDPEAANRVRNIAEREKIRHISEKLREGDLNPALEFIAPDEGPKRDAASFSLNFLKPIITTEIIIEDGEEHEIPKVEQPKHIDGSTWQEMLRRWHEAGTTKEEASVIIQMSSLEDDDKDAKIQEIENRLGSLSDFDGDPDDVESTPDEKSQRRTALEEAQRQALAEIEDLPEEEKIKYRKKMSNLGKKLTDYFAEGEPGRKYARKGGRILYFALLTAVILLLLEMNIINKAASRGQRRG